MKFTNVLTVMKIPKLLLPLGFVLFAFSIAANAQTEDLDYSSGSQGEDGALSFPSPLNINPHGVAIAGDTNRNEAVVFGGYDSAGNLSSATWVWTKENGWEEKFPENSPPARSYSLMCYDSDRKEIILYGGWSQNGQLNDTWVWNGDDWQQKTQENPPFIDYWNSAMVYDATRKRAVIISPNNWYGSGNMYFLDGTSWTQESISMPASNIYNFSAAYDAKNGKIILLTQNGETLLFDGASWVKSETAMTPLGNSYYYYSNRNNLAYDAFSQKIIYFGSSGGGENNYNYYGNDTWAWDGANWEESTPDRSPSPRQGHVLAGIGSGVVLVGGWGDFNWEYYMENTPLYGSTEFWDGENWNYSSGGVCDIDMNEKEDGVWRYSSITIPKGMVVRFNKNERNSPVQWLASGHVEVDGIIDVSGEKGENFSSNSYHGNISATNPLGNVAKGGVGGFAGGQGGIHFQETGSYAGMPGVGPGGGAPGINNTGSQESYGKPGGFTGSADSSGAIISTYGNTYLQPLVGGSGGGGSASSDSVDGVSGGGGGGAILIASTRDITINGRILANGGDAGYLQYNNYNNNSYDSFYTGSGAGSGGAIRLAADRVVGKGNLRARGGNNNYYYSDGQIIATTGRIRIEAYERDLANSPSNFPAPFQAPPILSSPIKNRGTLRVESVSGKIVTQPPTGNLESPDVEFDAAGSVRIIVSGQDVADGTQVRVRVTMLGAEFVSQALALSEGKAEFDVTVPAGEGTIQAYSLRSINYATEESSD